MEVCEVKLQLTRLNLTLAYDFALQYHPWITWINEGHTNKWNDHQPKKLLIVKQILLVSTLVNV